MDNREHLETSGPFTGLWVRTAGALRKAGYKSRRKVRADIQAGTLHPFSWLVRSGLIQRSL